jgi:hypothetical protein
MDWVQDMTARWLRILTAADGGGTPLDEAVRQISAIADTSAKKGRPGRPGRLRRHAAAAEDASTVTVLCRQLIAGVLVSDMAIARLCSIEGQSREQVLGQLAADAPEQLRDQQVRALQVELSGSRALLKDREPASYSGLGARIEQLLRLAEQQATELVETARAEAARITASAGAPSSASGLGAGQDDPGLTEGHLGGPEG